MSKPVISFVIPVYKKPVEVFRKCLVSLFDQSLKEIEVIAVFDGEDAELQAVAKEFPKVKQIVIEHGGAPKARNAGTAIAKGQYIACWDSDCYAKPDMAKRWIQEFEARPDVDFVYTGYEFAGEQGGESSAPFDPYTLTCGNYISSMSPIKREKAPKWDESLPAGQDWDFWLTVVEQGGKGAFIEGSGFITDTIRTGLSSDHWRGDNRVETIERIRAKHGITDRHIAVYSANYPDRAVKVAKLLNADVFNQNGHGPEFYKMIINIGYTFLSRFEGVPDEVVKVQYWVPGEIEGLAEARYSVVMETIRVAKQVHNYCNTDYEKNKLEELGISATVLPLPLAAEEIAKTRNTLPETFKILLLTDKAYGQLLKDLPLDLPHIEFGYTSGKIDEYSCVISFYRFAALDDPILIAHLNGRHVISNVQAPYCGFIDPDQSWDRFKEALYERIKEVRQKPFNEEAKNYYLDVAAPSKFIEELTSHIRKPLEVVS